MADPATIGAISLGTSVASGVAGIFGAKASADASEKSYLYKAQVAKFNKQINEQNARWALDTGEIKSMEAGLKAGQDIANTKVAQAASGFDVTGGSAEAVRDTQGEVAKFDQDILRYDARKTAFGYLAKAKADEMEADFDTMAAKNAKKAGTLGMLSSFLTGAGNVSGKWLQGSSMGLWGGSGGGGGSTLSQELDYSMS